MKSTVGDIIVPACIQLGFFVLVSSLFFILGMGCWGKGSQSRMAVQRRSKDDQMGLILTTIGLISTWLLREPRAFAICFLED